MTGEFAGKAIWDYNERITSEWHFVRGHPPPSFVEHQRCALLVVEQIYKIKYLHL